MDIVVIIKIAIVGFVTAICCMFLKRVGRDDIATIVTVAGLIVALVVLIDNVSQLYNTLSGLFEL